ncbi:hypothetical protein CgunFtcFv8_015937 [Champsocephalus gunnari]|uniref:Uncharacterized protein n=1 Tax=Champsocephalus gunnari TaxID=52237 RepID=A0AAN8C6Q3_CHAGU|nr:hypothetical protein CgunFtcFv8_015937 [Champsocephalus gunnari]
MEPRRQTQRGDVSHALPNKASPRSTPRTFYGHAERNVIKTHHETAQGKPWKQFSLRFTERSVFTRQLSPEDEGE